MASTIEAAQLVVPIKVTGNEQAKKDLTSVGQTAKDSQKNLFGLLAPIAPYALGAGAAILGLGVATTMMAGNFQSGITTLETGAGESAANLGMVSQGILNLAVSTGTSTAQLTAGMYMIESAGYHGAAGLDVLKAAAEGAKVGNADLSTVANAETTIMTDFASSHVTASQAVNELIATVSQGKTTMQDLSGALSQILPTASAAGVGLNDVMAAMATMTGEGVPAADAATYLRQTLIGLDAPGSKAVSTLASIGLKASDVSAEMQKSLPDALKMITDALAKKFPVGSAAYVNALKDIAGGSKNMQGILDLTGTHLATFQGNVGTISGTVKGAGNSIQGWGAVQQDFNFKLDKAKEVVETLGIKIGTALLPVAGSLADAVSTRLIPAFNTAVVVGKNVVDFTVKWHDPILAAAGALTLFFVPAIIQAGVESVASGAKVALNFVGSIIASGTAGWEAAGNIAVWIGSTAASGAAAVANGAKVAASFTASIIASGVESGVAAAKMTASFVASLVKTAAQAVITGGVIAFNVTTALVSMAAEGIVAAATAIPGLIVGFVGWAISAGAAAIATIAATWPILAVIAGIALLVAGIVLLVTHWSQVTDFLSGVWKTVMGWVQTGLGDMGAAFNALGSLVGGVGKGLGDAIKGGINDVIGAINAFIRFLDSIQIHIPAVGVGPVHTPAFDWNGLGIGQIPSLAQGGVITRGGLALVGDAPEFVDTPQMRSLPQGAQVTPLNRANNGPSRVINIYPSKASFDEDDLIRYDRMQSLLERTA